MLKFVYNNDCGEQFDTIEALNSTVDADGKRVILIMGLLTIADKYGLRRLVVGTTQHLRHLLSQAEDFTVFKVAIHQHYDFSPALYSLNCKM
jgi:hypothetical protein